MGVTGGALRGWGWGEEGRGGVGRRVVLTEHFTACGRLLDASQVELLLGEGLDVLWERRRGEGTGGMREGRGSDTCGQAALSGEWCWDVMVLEYLSTATECDVNLPSLGGSCLLVRYSLSDVFLLNKQLNESTWPYAV